MMHPFGGGFGMGFMPFFGLVPFILVGGAIYLLFRYRHRINHDAGGRGNGDRLARRSGRPRASELYRLAHSHGGALTVSDVVVELGVEPKDAEASLEAITDGQRVQMEVGTDGGVFYRFVEIAGGGSG